MQPDYRDIPIEQVPSPILAQHYRELVLYAADHKQAGWVLLQAALQAVEHLDAGNVAGARAVLMGPLKAAAEAMRHEH